MTEMPDQNDRQRDQYGSNQRRANTNYTVHWLHVLNTIGDFPEQKLWLAYQEHSCEYWYFNLL